MKKKTIKQIKLEAQTCYLSPINKRWIRTEAAKNDMYLYEFLNKLCTHLRKNKFDISSIK